jgi:Ca2+/Na+ antiporter
MFNKNYLFIFISILLAFIISSFYNKNMNINFLMIFIVLSLFFYIVFYYLGTSRESYTDYNKFYNHNYNTYDNLNNHILRDNLEESENIEEEIHQKEYKDNLIKKYLENQQIEEEISNIIPQENKEVNNYNQQTQEEEVNKIPYNEIVKPDINKILLENPIAKAGSPLNINISYNSQNSINELDNNENKNKDCKYNKDNKNNSKNLGSYCDNSRVYNNSDWVYGSNAWNNDPDYYIPNKGCNNKYEKDNNCVKEVPQPLNELINANKYRENKNVCPLMINTPWTEYKTGDSEPEPYNL